MQEGYISKEEIIKKLIFAIIFIFLLVGIIIFLRYKQEPKAFYTATSNPKLIHIREELKQLKKELRRQGKYSCCIRNDCNWCAIYMGHCPCAKLVFKKGEEKSCPECAAAWNRKQGKFFSVDPRAIKVTTFGVYGFEEDAHSHHH